MLLSIAADERAALQFADLASALDAGLPLPTLGGEAAAGDRALHTALRTRGIRLSATEDAVLAAAWRSGRASEALRRCAVARERRAGFARRLWEGLRYPLLLLGMLFVASAASAAVVGPQFLYALLAGLAVLAAGALWIRAQVHRGARWLARAPIARQLLPALGELPYLETLHALYASGVPLAQAHAEAVGTVRVALVRERLDIADRILQTGRPLRAALEQALALHPETRALLAGGEQAGQLEDALLRAFTRRSDVAARDVQHLARRAGQFAYFAAVALCAVLVLRFYGGYFGLLRG